MPTKFKTIAEKFQDIWQGNEPSNPQISNSKVDLQGKISRLMCAFLLLNSSWVFWVYISLHLHLAMQKNKKRAKSREGTCALPCLCFKTVHVRAPNPLDTNCISCTQKLFITAEHFPPRGMSTSRSGVLCKELGAVFEQAAASAQQRAAGNLPVGAVSSAPYLVQTCPVFAALVSVGSCLSVQTPPPTSSDFQDKR